MSLRFPNFYLQILDSFRIARKNKQLPFWIVSALSIYLPFEDFIVAWLHLPDAAQTGMRFIPELIIYGVLIRVLYLRISSGQRLVKTPIDILVLAFFAAAIFSMIINNSSLISSLADNLRTTWRYLALYYLLVNINISQQQITQILRIIRASGLFQAYIGSLQFFIPAKIKIALAAGSCEKAAFKGASCGTFLDSALLSGFMMIAIVIFVVYIYQYSRSLIPKKFALINLAVLYFGMFASKKRAALIIALLIPLLVLNYLGRKRNTKIFLWFSGALAAIVAVVLPLISLDASKENTFGVTAEEASESDQDLTSYFFLIFSPDYWEQTLSSSRGWVAVRVIDSLIASGNWFGFGPDPESVIRGMSRFLSTQDTAKLERDIEAFDDAYWFAILAYVGIVGLVLYVAIILRLYQISKRLMRNSNSEQDQSLGVIFATISLISLIYGFVERVFRLRPFSFYFWILAGLMVNSYHQNLKEKSNSPQPDSGLLAEKNKSSNKFAYLDLLN